MVHIVSDYEKQDTKHRKERRAALSDAQKKARDDRDVARRKHRLRKLDTRRKIIVGAALIAKAKNGQKAAKNMLHEIYAALPDRDKKLFTEWFQKEDKE
jgi:uncharacterized membrane protein